MTRGVLILDCGGLTGDWQKTKKQTNKHKHTKTKTTIRRRMLIQACGGHTGNWYNNNKTDKQTQT